jgi:hypothetical protein
VAGSYNTATQVLSPGRCALSPWPRPIGAPQLRQRGQERMTYPASNAYAACHWRCGVQRSLDGGRQVSAIPGRLSCSSAGEPTSRWCCEATGRPAAAATDVASIRRATHARVAPTSLITGSGIGPHRLRGTVTAVRSQEPPAPFSRSPMTRAFRSLRGQARRVTKNMMPKTASTNIMIPGTFMGLSCLSGIVVRYYPNIRLPTIPLLRAKWAGFFDEIYAE